MRRNRNWLLWSGFLVALFAIFSYIPIFMFFPVTRGFPWINLLLFLAAGCLLALGLFRAFTRPAEYRGKISGPILASISLILGGLLWFGVYSAASLPSAAAALRVGQQAPDFKLAGSDGRPVTLAQLLQGKRAVLLIFYRGYW